MSQTSRNDRGTGKMDRSGIIGMILGMLLVLPLNALSVHAAKIHSKAGTTSATFLKIGAGARATAMGEAFGAVADDASALYWNPAGASQLDLDEFTVMHDESFQDIRYEYAAYVHPLSKRRAIGISASGLFLQNDLERRSGLGESIPETPLTPAEGTFGAHDISAGISYAWHPKDRLAVGATLKAVQQTIANNQGNSVALDLGSLYSFRRWPLKVAAVAQNIGPALKLGRTAYALPLNFKLSSAWTYNPKLDLTFDVNQPIDNYLRLQTGLEYRPFAFCGLRAGYMMRTGGNDLGSLSGMTLGAGFGFGRVRMDYAFNPMGDLGDNHRISISYKFGRGGRTQSAAKPAADAPSDVEAIPFRISLKPLKEKNRYRVLAEADAPAELYRMTFDVESATADSSTLSLWETGPDENDESLTYQVITMKHGFPSTIENIGMAFRVKKSWLQKNKLEAGDVTLVRMDGKISIPQATRVTAENAEYVSYRAQVDREGTLMIRGNKPSK